MARRLGGTCGIPAYDDRTYVGVLVMTYADGMMRPCRVVWEDGRWWDVLRSTQIRKWGRADWGNVVIEFELELGRRGCFRHVFWEGGRWFVAGSHGGCRHAGTDVSAPVADWMTEDRR